MAIDLPNFGLSKSIRIVACGAVYTDESAILEWLKAPRRLIASYTKGGTRHFVRMMTGGRKDRHFHFEVATAKSFSKHAQPTVTSKISDVQNAVETVMGAKIDLNVVCDFLIDFDQLPEGGPIRLLSSETRVAGTSVQLTAGVLSVSGSRISEIGWSRYSDDKVVISLEANLDSIVARKYLQEGQELMERFFRVLVLNQPNPES